MHSQRRCLRTVSEQSEIEGVRLVRGALADIRVLDFGQYVAGPVVGMLLADQGADVIRIDPPGGSRYDGPANVTWNRSKRSLSLNLKEPEERELAWRLVTDADVVIENFRPGVMDRLGLGPTATTRANRRLIYCSLPGFASDDRRAGVRAWEGVVAAAAGTFRRNASTGRPVYTPLPFSSFFAAFQAATAIAMALNARQADGHGQTIEVPLFDATFGAVGNRIMFHRRPRADTPGTALRGNYRCRDGRWVCYVSGNKEARRFLESVGALEWSDAADAGLVSAEEFNARAEELFLQRTAAEWEEYCHDIGTECAVCRSSAEWLAHEGALDSGIVVDLEDHVLGVVRGPGPNVRMSATPPSIRAGRPQLDAHRKEILAELRAPVPSRAPLADAVNAFSVKRALDGVRVLDLCIVLAGPTCGRTLAEFGADVIKIDSPSRASQEGFHNEINRGKRSLILDLKMLDGMEVFWHLVDTADVVLQNFRRGVADRLGIGYEAVRARKPNIVYASLNAYGQLGPLAGRPGHEQIAQAATGMQERFGGEGRPVTAPFAANDYGTGYMGAFAVALALLHRQRTGEGQHVDTALAYTATMLQSSVIQSFAGKQWDEPRGQGQVGSGPLDRCYEATDGWFYLGARRADLAVCPEVADLVGVADNELGPLLEERFRGHPVDEWVAILTNAGIGAHTVVPDVTALIDDPWLISHGLLATREHDRIGPVTTTGPTPRMSKTPPDIGHPAPVPGAHTEEILAGIGMRSELDRLRREGAIPPEATGVAVTGVPGGES